MATTTVPQSLNELLHEVFSIQSEKPRIAVLIDTLRKYKFWPALQVKKFFTDRDLVLLHNTYKREDTERFQVLYDECRSVVLNLAAPEGQSIVVTYTAAIPQRMSDAEYEVAMQPEDRVELGFEGTTVTAYFHNDEWRFGTTSCPSVDSSRYFHPTKTHGMMFDEALSKLVGAAVPQSKDESKLLRAAFAERLDTNKAYAFLLVHHDNKHIMDYTNACGGDAEYAFITCISVKDRVTLDECDVPADFNTIPAGLQPVVYNTPDDALNSLRSTPESVYALIVKRQGCKLLKVSLQSVVDREDHDLGNPNVWLNMLHVYIKNRADYKIVDYQREYAPDVVFPKTTRGRELAPTYLVHTIICNIRDILYNTYSMTTSYNPHTRRYTINRQLDSMYAPIIRFHLAQLRSLQVLELTGTVTPHTVYNYICHRQTLKNLRLLVKHIAAVCHDAMTGYMTVPYGLPYHVAECFVIFDGLLSA